MIIKLDEVYYIQVNGSTFDLGKKVPLKNGEVQHKPFAYCSTLKQAVDRYIQESLSEKDTEVSLRECVILIENKTEEVMRMVSPNETTD